MKKMFISAMKYIWYSKTCDDFLFGKPQEGKFNSLVLYIQYNGNKFDLKNNFCKLHFHTNINFCVTWMTRKLYKFATFRTIVIVTFSMYNLWFTDWKDIILYILRNHTTKL